jgi:hypothetical protein
MSLTAPQQYSSEMLTPTQITMVLDLRDFGLVYFPQVSMAIDETCDVDLHWL